MSKQPLLGRFLKDTSGATMVEYALIAGLIGLGLVFTLGDIRTTVSGFFADALAGLN